MKLPFSFGFTKKEKKEYFLALLLKDEKVNAVVFEELSGKIHVIGRGEEYFLDSIETATLDELLEIFDKVIATAETNLPSEIQTSKTILGVKETWVEDAKIKKEYLTKLKKACDALSLTPIGFLVIQEAITHLLQQEEGAPISAILVDIGNKNIEVSLVRAGKILETKRTLIENSVVYTVDTLLHEFTNYEVLPARIIIFHNKNHETLSQTFITHSWNKNLPFLHVPQTTILPKDFDAKAVVFGAASQMGFEVLEDMQLIKHEETLQEKEETAITTNKQHHLESTYTHEDFGFIKDADILNAHITKHEEENKDSKPFEEVTNNEEAIPEELPKHVKHSSFESAAPHTQSLPEQTGTQSFSVKSLLSGIPGILFFPLSFIARRGKALAIPGNKKYIILPPVFLSLCITLVLIYIFMLKATVTLTLKPRVIEQNADITFTTKGPTDFSKNIIAAQTVEVSQDGKASAPATGKKEIGTKAKGTVTLLSSLRKEQILPQGTILTSSSGPAFITDNDVKIASSSGLSNLISVKAQVTAKDIGKESNLPSGTRFTVTSFDTSEIEAKNESAFSGGTKKEIIVVSKDDIAKLTESLPKNLQEKAKNELNKKISGDEVLIPLIIGTTLTKKNFDKDEGEESSTITLTGTVSYQWASYKKNNMEDFAKLLLQNNIPQASSQEGITYDVQNVKQKNDNEITALFHTKGFFLPKVDTLKITTDISGKSFEETTELLSKLPQVNNSTITLQPNLPFFPKLLPRFGKNISIAIQKE